MDASAELFQPVSGRCSIYFACFWSHEHLPNPATSFVIATDARVRVRYDKEDAQGRVSLCSDLPYSTSMTVLAVQKSFPINLAPPLKCSASRNMNEHAKGNRSSYITMECRWIWVWLARVRANNGIADSQPYSRWRITVAWHERAQMPARRDGQLWQRVIATTHILPYRQQVTYSAWASFTRQKTPSSQLYRGTTTTNAVQKTYSET